MGTDSNIYCINIFIVLWKGLSRSKLLPGTFWADNVCFTRRIVFKLRAAGSLPQTPKRNFCLPWLPGLLWSVEHNLIASLCLYIWYSFSTYPYTIKIFFYAFAFWVEPALVPCPCQLHLPSISTADNFMLLLPGSPLFRNRLVWADSVNSQDAGCSLALQYYSYKQQVLIDSRLHFQGLLLPRCSSDSSGFQQGWTWYSHPDCLWISQGYNTAIIACVLTKSKKGLGKNSKGEDFEIAVANTNNNAWERAAFAQVWPLHHL